MNKNISSGTESMRKLFPPAKISPRQAKSCPGIVFNPRKCDGCGKCVTACSSVGMEEGKIRDSRIQLLQDEESKKYFAILCQHCLDPQCVKACPQGAISKGRDGIVRINEKLCVHCGICTHACPEAAPLRTEHGKIVKCDLCEGKPACVDACPQGALSYTHGKRFSFITPLRWIMQALSFFLLVVVLIGSVCSLNIATIDIACPFGALQNIFSTKFILLSTLISAALLFLFSFIFGRAFCGWICPFGFILDCADKILPHFPSLRLPSFLRHRFNKYGIAVGSLAAAGAVQTQAFCAVCPIGTVCRSHGLNSVMAGAETAIVPVIAALNVGEKRTWCRYFCPVGATLAIAAKIGLVRIEIGAPSCKKFSCMRCADICPMGIIPKEKLGQGISPKINMSECITCMRCVSTCPHGAASIRFVLQKAKTKEGNIPSASTSPSNDCIAKNKTA